MKGAEPNVLTYFRKILSTARPETFMPCLFFLSLLFVSIFDQTTMAQAQK